MNEWTFAGEIAKWWEAAGEADPSLGITRTLIEDSPEGTSSRADMTVYDDRNHPVLVLELRLPDHAHPSPFDMNNLNAAVAKAQRSGARWAATSDADDFILLDTALQAPVRGMLRTPIKLNVPATRAGLDVPAKRTQVRGAWLDLLTQIAPVLLGRAHAPALPPDEVFVESLRALLARPVAAIRDTVSARKDHDRAFSDGLVSWMVDQQGWPHENREFESEIERVAELSAYVFTTRLLFYEALRRAQPALVPLSIPSGVIAASAVVRAIFDEARRVSGDYETVFDYDAICDYALISDDAVDGWRRVVSHLEQFELDAISYDVLGKLFERLIDPQERYKWGQHYTAPNVVDLMLSLAIPDGSGPIMDSASGGGTFLVRGYVRKSVLNPGQSPPICRYGGEVTARAEVLRTARYLAAASRDGTFTIEQVVRALATAGSRYQESTIRTHVASVMCANAPETTKLGIKISSGSPTAATDSMRFPKDHYGHPRLPDPDETYSVIVVGRSAALQPPGHRLAKRTVPAHRGGQDGAAAQRNATHDR